MMSYIDIIKDKARMDRKTIVLPETTDKRTLIAAAQIIQEGIANIIMIGDAEKIMDGATWLEIDLTGVKIVNPLLCEKLEDYVQLLYETRKNKGMTVEKAREILLSDPLTFGVIMVKANDADGMVAGACHATAGYPSSCLTDSEDSARREAGIRFLSDVCTGLRIWREWNLPVCRLWTESGSYSR